MKTWIYSELIIRSTRQLADVRALAVCVVGTFFFRCGPRCEYRPRLRNKHNPDVKIHKFDKADILTKSATKINVPDTRPGTFNYTEPGWLEFVIQSQAANPDAPDLSEVVGDIERSGAAIAKRLSSNRKIIVPSIFDTAAPDPDELTEVFDDIGATYALAVYISAAARCVDEHAVKCDAEPPPDG